ncbi:MAG TPA: methionyl-tRNA formyltransferase [Steroidobacteraceae bacterium]|jgi:methionyl-tRNA formyltransferase|nr:methionyl-tRNA formyltransferase [Steroidobacteraceae bacterium]
MRIVFAGTPEFAVPTLLSLMDSPHQLVGILTQPDRPRGRGQRLTPSPVKAAGMSVPLAQPQSLRSAEDRAQLAAWRPDVLVVVAYGLILPKEVLQIPRLGCVNVHASLLPRWRGAAPIERAILAGDETTGVTIMLMDEGLDTGPALLQQPLAIDAADTGASLRGKLAALGAPLLLEALRGLENGTLHPRPQPADGVTYARKLEKREAPIDWRRSAAEIERQVRALQPWPVAETSQSDPDPRAAVPQRLLIHAARVAPVSGPPDAEPSPAVPPGSIVETDASHDSGYIRVQCGSGRLDLLTLQRPGGQRLSASVFTRGPRALEPAMVLGRPA